MLCESAHGKDAAHPIIKGMGWRAATVRAFLDSVRDNVGVAMIDRASG
jgi:hypothetical protein